HTTTFSYSAALCTHNLPSFPTRRSSDLKTFFPKITSPENTEDALDDVVDGVVQAAVVDRAGLEAYKRRKPGRFNRLKEVARSQPDRKSTRLNSSRQIISYAVFCLKKKK